MRVLVSKILRFTSKIVFKLTLFIRVLIIKFKYPSIIIDKNTIIEKNCNIKCTDTAKLKLINSYISKGTSIVATRKSELSITGSFIGQNCMIVSTDKITINKGCEIAEMVVIRDQNHIHNLIDTPIAEQGFDSSPITIDTNVWIGAKSSILKGVNIGKNSIIGAHALVNKDINPGTINAGIPSKLISKNEK